MISFETVYHDYGKDVYRLLFRLCGNQHDTEDLLQETFISIMRNLPEFKGDSSLKTWICSIAINKFRDRCRAVKIRKIDFQAEVELTAPDNQHDELVAAELRVKVKKAFHTLPEEHQIAFALVRFDGMSYKEAALALGTTLGTIRMRVHRAHHLLADILRER